MQIFMKNTTKRTSKEIQKNTAWYVAMIDIAAAKETPNDRHYISGEHLFNPEQRRLNRKLNIHKLNMSRWKK